MRNGKVARLNPSAEVSLDDAIAGAEGLLQAFDAIDGLRRTLEYVRRARTELPELQREHERLRRQIATLKEKRAEIRAAVNEALELACQLDAKGVAATPLPSWARDWNKLHELNA